MAPRPRSEARRAGQREGNAGSGMAKIYHSLYDRMLNEKGLLQAFAKVKSNKGSSGVDGQTIYDFAEHSSEEIALLADTHLLRNSIEGSGWMLCDIRRGHYGGIDFLETKKPVGDRCIILKAPDFYWFTCELAQLFT
jgi:hypothetical protein